VTDDQGVFTRCSSSPRLGAARPPYGAAMSSTAVERTLPLEGAFNFRDMGGYPTTDGRRVKWRTLFRADGLDTLTGGDLSQLGPIGLRTVVDLRSAHEVAERGTFPVDDYPVTFHHLSVMDTTWDRDELARRPMSSTEFLHWAYTSMLADGAPRFATAFGLLAERDALPAVFHCAAGKDRTGLLAALLLGSLNVEREAIVADYALTEVAMPRFLERMRGHADGEAKADQSPRAFFAADAGAMELVLTDIEAAHGSVRSLMGTLGVTDETLQRLDELLLTDAC